MAIIMGSALSEKFNLFGKYIWNGSSWVLTSPSGTTASADIVQAGGGNDEVDGGGGNDLISGEAGNDLLTGGAGNDIIDGGSGNDTVYGGTANLNSTGSGNDLLSGGSGLDTIYGGDGNDIIDGGSDDDVLFGEAGNDTINGGSGADVLTGGTGADKLAGGSGGDIYIYNDVTDSKAGANFKFSTTTGDVLSGFDSATENANAALRDKIDLTGLVTSSGHSLTWANKTAGAYKVWYEVSGGNTFVSADTTGDGKADVVIKMAGTETLSAADFIGLGATDNIAPTVTSVAYGANDGTLKAGDTILITVSFSEAVIIAGGTPTLSLNTGGVATCTAGSGTSTLTFSYTVGAGQNTGDLAVNALNPNLATIKDAAGNSANLAGAVSNPSGVVIDTVAPAAPSVTLVADTGSSTSDEVTSNGALSVTGVEDGATVEYSTDGGTVWSSSFTATEGDNTIKVRQVDAAGNASAATDFAFTLDTEVPAPVITGYSDDAGAGDGTTTDTTLTITGTTEAFATVAIYDGALFLGTTTAEADGTWTFDTPALSLSTHDFTATATDSAGNTSDASAAVSVAVVEAISGTAIDGYIAGATVFADANDNGVLDAGEASTTTDATGSFTLEGGSGPLVLQGGTDISTGQSFVGTLRAPEGASTITPLTTLVVAVAEANGITEAEAQAAVIDALGLDPAIGDLSDFDPIAAALSSDPAVAEIGAAAAAAAITVQNTIIQGSALLAGAGVDQADAEAAMLGALASQIAVGGGAVDLADTATLTQIVTDAATETDVDTLAPETIEGAVTVIGAVNEVVAEAAVNSIGADLLTNLAQVQIVVQTEITSSLAEAGENNDASNAVNDFTGTALEDAVDDAADQVGDIDGGTVGTAGDNVLTGGAASDAIDGLAGNDTISGEGGNDILTGGLGEDTLTGGAGIDTYVWNEGDGYDTILSTGSGPSEDVIRIEGAFYDYNWTIDGDDLIVGVTADDSYDFATVGGSLRIEDFFSGNDSIAYLEANLGDNNGFYSPDGGDARIYFNTLTGADQGNNYEVIIGTSSDDVMTDTGGAGQNRFVGLDGNDTMTVAAGTSGVLVGGNGNDTLTGAELDDHLRGAAGNDVMDGGNGIDIARYDRPSGSAPITSGAFVNLSSQDATFDFNGDATTIAGGTAIDNYGGTDTLSNIENVQGSTFDDVLVGTSGANTLRGLDGNDTLVAGGNDAPNGGDLDFLYGGGGADSFVFGTEAGDTHIEDFELGTDVLRFQGDVGIASLEVQNWGDPWGLTTVVTLTTGATVALVSVSGISDASELLAPPITATDDPDALAGTSFNDTLVGGFGDDTLTGGAGVDTYVWNEGDGYDTIQSTGSGGSEDVIRIEGTFYDFDWAVEGSDLIVGVVADDNYDFATTGGNLRIENFFAGGDSIAYLEVDVGANNNFYSPGGGSARIHMSAVTGTDQGNYFELIEGTSGNDVMTDAGGTGQNRFDGFDGNDTITVAAGTSGELVGGNGNDTLTGAELDDQLRGAAGNDVMDGGNGIDIARYDRPSGSAPITSGAFVNLSNADATYDFNGTSETVAAGTAIDNYGGTDTLANIEDVRGSAFDDVLVGTSGANTLRGDDGDDILVAGGNDAPNGGDLDFLYGGGGADSFVFGTEAGDTHIEDFELGTDVLRFQGDVGIASLEVQNWGDPWGLTTVVTLTTGATVALVSVSGISDASELLAPPIAGTDDPDALAGTSFNDTLVGGLGNDTLTGGAGIDTYVWSAGDGYDTILSTGSGPSEDVIRIEGAFYDYNWTIDGDDLIVGVTADDSYDFATVGGSLRIEDFFSGNDSIAYLEANLGDNNGFYSPDGGDARIYFNTLTGADQGNNYEVIIGTSSDDVMTDTGGAGQNRFVGLDGNDTMTVAAGTSGVLVGGNGNDTLTGAELDDHLRGAAGNDVMDGGNGIDIARYDRPSGSAPITSGAFVNLSSQDATFDFNGDATTIAGGTAIDNYGGTDTLSNIENVQGSTFDDVLVGTSGANTLRGLDGNDTLVAGGNDAPNGGDLDFLYGGGGADSFVFGTEAGDTHIEDFELGTDVLRFQGDVGIASLEVQNWGDPWGLTTVVTLTTGATVALVSVSGISDASELLAPPIAGTDDPDALAGTSFNDTLVGGLGNDTLTGGAGIDTYVWSAGDGYDTILSTGSGPSEDVIRIEGAFYDYNWTIDGDDLIVGVTADDSYDFATVGGSLRIEDFFSGNDSIAYLEANLGDNNGFYSPDGGDARIYFNTLTGADQGNNYEVIIGTSSDDVMTDTGGAGQNRFVGLDGNDTMTVAAGTSGVLVGGNGNDTLTGAELDDHLRGAAGNDVMDGGNGIDIARYDRPSGSAPITSGAFVNLSSQDATFDFNGDATTIAGGTAIDNYGGTDTLANIEDVRGSAFDDVLVGNAGDNSLEGLAGDDILAGGAGNDWLSGGNGADSFVFGPEISHDVIDDFAVGTDSLEFQGGVSIATFAEFDDDGDTVSDGTLVTFTTGATVALNGVTGVNDANDFLV